MPTVWFSLKNSLNCKSEPSDVSDPKSKRYLSTFLTRKACKSGCSRSIANLKDVIHGSKRPYERPPSCSPRSIGSSEFLNPITHEVILGNSRSELKITGFGGFQEGFDCGGGGGGGGSTFLGTLRTGNSTTPTRKNSALFADKQGFGVGGCAISGSGNCISSKPRDFIETDGNGSSAVTCHKCGEQFGKWEALEAHHLSKHAITELVEGDSSRKIVEIICRSSWLKSESHYGRIEKVFKIHNMQKTLARFEEYREMVKIKANKLPKKHPRCLADGNELLRFYGTTLTCSIGMNGCSSLCISDKCRVCRIIRNGFSTRKELKGGIGVFTTSTSGRAFECIEIFEDDSSIRKALIVCRVIAGRVHKPLENKQEMVGQTGFDSLAGKVGLYSNVEELYLLNPRALLPCFVVICKT